MALPAPISTVEVVPGLAALPLLQQASLVYAGAFRVPAKASPPYDNGLEYAWKGLTFNPLRNSLYIVGHDNRQEVAEISIPQLRTGPVEGLAVATILQPPADSTDGRRSQISNIPGDNVKVGGLLVHGGQLVTSCYVYYDGNGTAARASHFTGGLTLSVQTDVRGPFKLSGAGPGFVGGYMATVPQAWQQALGGPALTGQGCIGIITRTSYGPSAFSFDPATLANGSVVHPLVYYDDAHQTLGGYAQNNPLFGGATDLGGIAFPEKARSLLFFGRQGAGSYCYGEGVAGVAGPGQCHDPSDSGKGPHSYPYRYQVWAYDALQLARVRAGTLKPWEVVPYAYWPLPLPYQNNNTLVRIIGVAYDPATTRIYMAQASGQWPLPVLHAFTVVA